MSSNSFWTCPSSTMKNLRKKGAHLWYCWKGIGSARSCPDSRWRRSLLWLRLGSLTEVASVHYCPICLVWDTYVFEISNTPLWIDCRSGLPVPIYPSRWTSPRSSHFWVANHDVLGLVGNDREFHQISFWDISSARCGPHSALCFSFAVPSTMGSSLLDDVVLDWESIQSPLVKILAGFAFNQGMSASAIDHSLIPIKKAFWALHFWNCFA